MKKNISTVVFDFGNVLLKVDRLKICSHLSKHSALPAEKICRIIYGTEIEYYSETGKYDSREHFRVIKDAIKGDEGWCYEEFFHEFKDGFEDNPDGEEALKYAGEKARVFVLSNTTYLHSLCLFEHETLATIPELFIFSYKVGVMKPDRRIWDIMCARGSVKPEECLYIDDIEEYCSTAERIGFNVINYDINKMNLKSELKRWL
ncbi:MAG: hypothetical protein DRP57_12840 [Spirochaetes bacterium]|nr:MAG: hypothetical protein DRP57_12840 [Spirochaetota bacterium]